MANPILKFLDTKTKTTFETNKYVTKDIRTKHGTRKMAIASNPSGKRSFVFIKND